MARGIVRVSQKGGSGSGNWGHTGRPGLVGGSGGGAGMAMGAVAAAYPKSDMASADGVNGWQYNDRSDTLRKGEGRHEVSISPAYTRPGLEKKFRKPGFRLTYPAKRGPIVLPSVREFGKDELGLAMKFGDMMYEQVSPSK